MGPFFFFLCFFNIIILTHHNFLLFIFNYFHFSLKPPQKEPNGQTKSNPSKRHRKVSPYGLKFALNCRTKIPTFDPKISRLISRIDLSALYITLFSNFPMPQTKRCSRNQILKFHWLIWSKYRCIIIIKTDRFCKNQVHPKSVILVTIYIRQKQML